MKKTLLATVFAVSASSAFAGGLNEPVYEATVVPPTVVEADAMDNPGDEWVLALMVFLTIVVAGISQ